MIITQVTATGKLVSRIAVKTYQNIETLKEIISEHRDTQRSYQNIETLGDHIHINSVHIFPDVTEHYWVMFAASYLAVLLSPTSG